MPEIRRDIFSGSLVYVAEERNNRPSDFKLFTTEFSNEEYSTKCPFCKGNEGMAADTIYELKDGNGDWDIKIIKNLYPALTEDSVNLKTDNFFISSPGFGFHDVIIDTPLHNLQLHDFDQEKLFTIFKTISWRYEGLMKEDCVNHIQVFKNTGLSGGASKQHSHWQVIASPFLPLYQTMVLSSLYNHNTSTGHCLYCDMLKEELSRNERIIYEDDLIVAINPFASRFTYETWILPKRHVHSITMLSDNELATLASVFKNVLNSISKIMKTPEYNICLMEMGKDKYNHLNHWHIQIIPRRGNMAGYEVSTSSYINSLKPEIATKKLIENI